MLVRLCSFAALMYTVSGLGRHLLMRGSERANMLDNELSSDPLYLTPLIKSNQLSKARELSRVRNLPGLPSELQNMQSYSGYITTNDHCNSNIFFWTIKALNGNPQAPLLIWLQGGPGVSSLFGLFVEHGPMLVTRESRLEFRPSTWARNYSLLYIDNPVGTGFSFTDKDECYAKNEDDVATNLYEFLRQFYELFTEFHQIPLFVTGESYGGKYVPALTEMIRRQIFLTDVAGINLMGMAVGNGFSDPKNMLDYGLFLEDVGLADDNEADDFISATAAAKVAISEKRYEAAFEIFDCMMDGDLTPYPTYFHNITGYDFYLNFLQPEQPDEYTYFSNYLALPGVRDALHVGNKQFNDGKQAEIHLKSDIMNDVCDKVSYILNSNVPTLYYSGNLDIIVATPLTIQFLEQLKWQGQEDFVKVDKSRYDFNKNIAGYVRIYKNLIYASLRKAGHIVPFDQPELARNLIDRFVYYALHYDQRMNIPGVAFL